MTTVVRRDPADKAKIDAIERKLLANPDIAKLIDDLARVYNGCQRLSSRHATSLDYQRFEC